MLFQEFDIDSFSFPQRSIYRHPEKTGSRQMLVMAAPVFRVSYFSSDTNNTDSFVPIFSRINEIKVNTFMPNPLPLTVYGPVTPLSPSILVSGVLKDAVVTILDNGNSIGHGTAKVNGQLNVPISKPPTVGHNITAIQKSGFGTSEPSQHLVWPF